MLVTHEHADHCDPKNLRPLQELAIGYAPRLDPGLLKGSECGFVSVWVSNLTAPFILV